MMARKGTPRTKQHDWQPSKEEGKVYCTKCGVMVLVNDARRGVGGCEGEAPKDEQGEVEKQELSQEDIKARKPEMKPFAPSGDDHGQCNACGKSLKEMPFNSRLAMVACNNIRCNLYRERLRTIVIK
jgi:hypothetical protein